MKILIIKLGYSETFVNDDNRIVSLGDVLRTTPIIEALNYKYPESKIYWLTSKEAFILVDGAKFLNHTFVYSTDLNAEFDLVINLEKTEEIFKMLAKLKYKKLIGLEDTNLKFNHLERMHSWQEKIFYILGLDWREQRYNLGYKPNSKVKYQVGLNYLVGKKWPQKAMNMQKWQGLAKCLEKLGINYSWQEGKENLDEYIEWINSCQTIITQDSLGLHIALALNKKTIGIFGPTNPKEIYDYGNFTFLKDKKDINNIKLEEILDILEY